MEIVRRASMNDAQVVVVPQRPEKGKLVKDGDFGWISLSEFLPRFLSRTLLLIKKDGFTHGFVTECSAHFELLNDSYVSIHRSAYDFSPELVCETRRKGALMKGA